MNLKYTIKEVKTEERELTLPELCVLMVKRTTWVDRPHAAEQAEEYLKEIGFVSLVDEGQYLYRKGPISRKSKFRKETIRPATPEEIIAWLTIRTYDVCQPRPSCELCPKEFNCRIKEDYESSKSILANKEVIIEVVE